MTVTSKFRGNDIECIDGEWYFCESGEKTTDAWDKTQCGHCEKDFTPEGHDGCLGTLIGVMNACCGHGRDSGAYVQFLDGNVISGHDAIIIQGILKKTRS